MKTVGQILKETRLEKELSLEEIEKKTKIRSQYLRAIESNDFSHIPGGIVVAKGFIKNYAEHLDLSSKNLLAIFRRDFGKEQRREVLPRGIYKPLDKIGFSWTPKTTAIVGTLIFIFFFVIFLVYQFFLFLGPPKLQIISPQENQVFQESMIEVKGRSDQDAVVYVNDQLVNLDEGGNFSDQVSLTPGENKIRVEAVSRRGRKSIIERKIFYQFP